VARGVRAVGLAASTGGPEALCSVLAALPAEPAVPVFVVQHMTTGFMAGLARWLDGAVSAPVRMAGDGVAATPGIWLAPDDAHLVVDADLTMRLDRRERPGRHRPSADVLFGSLAILGPDAAVAVLTGMGDDGADGVRAVVGAGGLAIAQHRACAVVDGMPAAAAAAGAQIVLGLDDIGPALARLPARAPGS
jgi:two-component system chemotaxis response regulator CheB